MAMERYRVDPQMVMSNASRPLPSAPAVRRGESGGGGPAELVQDLSNKLAKQRKQLEELVAQKAATANTIRWYHVAGAMLLNNIVAVAVGFAGGSYIFGVGPFGDGSFEADAIHAQSLRVFTDDGPQSVVLQAPGEGNAMTFRLRAAEDHRSSLSLAGPSQSVAPAYCSMESANLNGFAFRQAGMPRISILGSENHTDILLATPDELGGALVVDDELAISSDTIRARNGSLTLRSAEDYDVVLQPAAAGIVRSGGGVEVYGTLAIGEMDDWGEFSPPVLLATPVNRSVQVGTAGGRVGRLQVAGATSIQDTLVVSGGLNVTEGDVRLGSADVLVHGDLRAVGESVQLGSDYNDNIDVRGPLAVATDDMGSIVEIDQAGNMKLWGTLTVEENAELKGDVILGSKPTDTVTINAFTTEMNSLIATGKVVLGNDDDDTTTIYGAFKVENDAGDAVLEIDPFTGNTMAEGTLHVEGGSWFRGTVTLGDGLEDEIFAYGSATVGGDTTMHKALNVTGDTFVTKLFASNVTLSRWLRLRNSVGECTFSVDPTSGDLFSAGELTITGNAHVLESTTVGGTIADLAEFHGPVSLRSLEPLRILQNLDLEGNAVVDGRADLANGSVSVGGDLRVDGGTTSVGSGPHHQMVLNGSLVFQHGPYAIFSVDGPSGNVNAEGQVRVLDAALFIGAVSIDAMLEVMGTATVTGGGLAVAEAVSVADALSIRGDASVDKHLELARGLVIDGDVSLGSTDSTELVMRGDFQVLNSTGGPQLRVTSVGGDIAIEGALSVDGFTSIASSVDLGDDASDQVTVHMRSVLHRDMLAKADVTLGGSLTSAGPMVLGSAFGTHGSGHLQIHGSVQLGDAVADVITLNADLRVTNQANETKVEVKSASGDVFAEGPLEVSGDIDVKGHITVPTFSVKRLTVDRLSERVAGSVGAQTTGGAGVTVEDVLFHNGRMTWQKAHEIHELTDQSGVVVDGVHLHDGAVTLRSRQAAVLDASETDLLTLVNTAHSALGMAGTRTSIQFVHILHNGSSALPWGPATSSVEAELVSGMAPASNTGAISVLTSNDWTPNVTTQNAMLSFDTARQGEVRERLRITSEGGFNFNNQVVFAAGGDIEIVGDVSIGAAAGRRRIMVTSLQAEAALKIRSGGFGGSETHDAKAVLTSSFGTNATSLFVIRNQGNPPASPSLGGLQAPVVRFSDGVDELMSLEDLGATANVHVSGTIAIGNLQSTQLHTMSIQSGAAAELLVQSGQDNDAALFITSGPGKQARLVLVDPAEAGDGSSFTLLNDGGDMRIFDTDENVMLSIVDRGATGDLIVSGDGVIGSKQSLGNRYLTVQANAIAEIDVIAGGSSSAVLSITSGDDRQATLTLIDPAVGVAGSQFDLLNDGASTDYPTLRLREGVDGTTMLTLSDISGYSEMGTLTVTGDGHFGGPEADSLRTLTVTAWGQATMEVLAGGTSDARATVTSGGDVDSKLILTNPTAPVGSTFEVFTDGKEVQPTLRITDGGSDGSIHNSMVKVVDTGLYGNLVVTGDGLFGGPDEVEPRTLTVRSAMASDVQVRSGAGQAATVHVRSGANKRAKLVLEDPGSVALGIAPAKFEIFNDGSEDSVPLLRITDGLETTLFSLADAGTHGNLQVSGSGLFGGSDITGDRVLNVTSGAEASLEAVSAYADASVTITAGPNLDSKLILGSEEYDGFGSYFELAHRGAVGIDPTLSISDGIHDMLNIVDRGLVGDLHVTGDTVIGGPKVAGPRQLTIESRLQSEFEIVAGDAADAAIQQVSGKDRDAMLVFENPSGPRFELYNDGSENEFATLRITDGSNVLASLRDKNKVGDLRVTGSALFGGVEAKGCQVLSGMFEGALFTSCDGGCCVVPPETRLAAAASGHHVAVQSAQTAAFEVTGGKYAVATVVSAADKDAMLVLRDPGDGRGGDSLFEIFNQGSAAAGTPTLVVSDGDSKLLSLVDRGSFATLDSTGDAVFRGDAAYTRDVTVRSGGAASALVGAGAAADASVTISAGSDKQATLSFTDPATVTGPIFEIKNLANATQYGNNPTLGITDGLQDTRIVTIQRQQEGNGAVLAYVTVDGTVACDDAHIGGMNILGNGREDQVKLTGHIAQAEIVVDANSDGNTLTLSVDDPPQDQTISVPDETGTILTNASSTSVLTTVGALYGGSIASGFGSIVSASNIATSGETSVSGSLMVVGDFVASGDTYLGDDINDKLLIRGTLVSDIRMGFEAKEPFGPEIAMGNGRVIQWQRDKSQRIILENFYADDSQKKETTFTARFNPTTIDSPPGDRVIVIPDVPSGGTIHISTVAFGKAAAAICATPTCPTYFQGKSPQPAGIIIGVNGVLMDVTAGMIESNTEAMPAHFEEQLFLKNRLIQSTSIIVANVADFGGGGRIHVHSVKVSASGQDATLVMRNIHPTEATTAPYRVAWAIFN